MAARRGSDGAPAGSETAARHLVESVPTARACDAAGEVRRRLAGRTFQEAGILCLTDGNGILAGAVSLPSLLAAPEERPVGELAEPDIQPVRPEDDQETVAGVAIRGNLPAVPVVDRTGRLLGVVPPLAMLKILRREHVEDIHRLAGIRHEAARARDAMEAPPLVRMRGRLPWLLAGLGGSMLATFVVSRFAAELERNVALAFFIPGIVYLADAIGTQTEAIVIRGLSMSRTPLKILLAGEFWTGFLIGGVLGLFAFGAVAFVFRDVRLALTVSLTVFLASGVATTVGLAFPWLLYRSGRDPAFGSGPLATIVQDVLSLAVYFGIALLVLE